MVADGVPAAADKSDFLTGGGEMGALVRAHDWSATPLGPIAGWPQSLRIILGTMLYSRHAMCLAWGPARTLFYNDAYVPFLRARHPAALGEPLDQVWSDVWEDIAPFVERAMGGEPVEVEDLPLVMTRHEDRQKTWWTFTYSPVRDEGGTVAGMLNICSESTDRLAAERRRDAAEAALRESEERYRQIVEGAEDFAIVALDERGTITSWNSGAERLLGYAETEASGQPGAMFFSDDDRAAGIPDHEMDRAFSEGRTINERWHQRKDGSLFWGSGLMMRLEGDGGGYLKMFRDRTAEHRAEAVLRESEERLRLVLDSASGSFYSVDRDGCTNLISRGFIELMGFGSEKEALGRKLHGLIHHTHPDGTPYPVEECPIYRCASSGEAAHVQEELFFRLDGSPVPVEYWVSPIMRGGEHIGAICTILDLTQRKQDEEALAARNRRLDLLARIASGLLIDKAPDERREIAFADIAREVGADYYFNYLTDEADPASLRLASSGGLNKAQHRAFERIAIGEYLCGRVAANREPVVIADLDRNDDPACRDVIDLDGKCYAGFPLIAEGRLLGTISFSSTARSCFTDDQLALMKTVADQVAAALDRDRAMSALRRSADEFEALAENVSQLAWMAEPDGSVFWYNKRWYDYTGTDLQSMKDWGWREVHHPDHVDRIIDEVGRNWTAGETWEGTYLLRSAAGEYRWFLTRAEPIRDEAGKLIRWFGTNTDITVQKTAEARQQFLLSFADRLRPLSDSREIVAAAVGVLGRHLGVSRAGYGEVHNDGVTFTFETDYVDGVEHLIGTFPADNFGPGNIADLRRGLTTTYADLEADPRTAGVGFPAIEARSAMAVPLIRDGRLRAVLYLNHREIREWLPDEVVLVQDFAARTWDTLERARAEAEVRDLNVTLEARVEQRTAELGLAQDALRQSQKLEAMGQLTGGVAHDFNNLLTPIVGSLDLLQRRGLGDAREQRLIDGALQSAERARVLVQRLLAFARRQPLQPSAVDVGDLIAGMAELVASTSGPNIKLEVAVADDLSPALADPNQLEMAILNLAVNARDAMRDGGTLTIAATDEEVGPGHRSSLPPGRYVHLSVADNGTGMDRATLARAVEPFFSTKGIGKGTGLGLSMVHGLASQLGGALAVSSKKGLGTNIDLWLPVSAARPGEATPAPEPPVRADTLGTVLLVDDEELVRMSTADMLTDLGWRVAEAESAEAALVSLDGGLAIDLLVTDHLMPGMTGADLARIVLERSPGTAVLVVSGFADTDEIAPDLPRLAKPFRQADLAASIAALAA